MIARIAVLLLVLIGFGCGDSSTRGVSQGSFMVGSPGRHFDVNAEALINLALNDWFSGKQNSASAVSYLDGRPLKRIALCKSYLPKDFTPHVFGAEAYLLDDRREDFQEGEVCIRIDSYTVAQDGTTTLVFVSMGKGYIGGAWITYVLKDVAGVWTIAGMNWDDP